MHANCHVAYAAMEQCHCLSRRLVAKTLGGSWFSTTTGGRCAEGERPGDGGSSGCTWRPVALKKAVNYSCVQANVAATVLSHGKTCFGGQSLQCMAVHRMFPVNIVYFLHTNS